MNSQKLEKKNRGVISNTQLVLMGFATAFFPRLLTYFGAPDPLNFFHLIFVPIVSVIVFFKARIKKRKQISIIWELVFGLFILLAIMLASALVNDAGYVNVALLFLFMSEPFLLLIGLMALPLAGEKLQKFQYWVYGFFIFNLILAIIQSLLLPIGLYPSSGQLYEDNIAGVFASDGGSAGNYISCTVSLYFSLYFWKHKNFPTWLRIALLVTAFYQTYISDSKQILVALFLGWILVVFTNIEKPGKTFLYFIPILLLVLISYWGLVHTDLAFLEPYRNFTVNRDLESLYGPNGAIRLLKTSAFRIIPSHYTTPLNHLFGLGPGHTATRLGGWFLRSPTYQRLLVPFGATIHPAVEEFWTLISGPEGWPARDSTMWFPMFTWVGFWGDLGFAGLGGYLYLGSIIWRRICVDDFGKFLLLSTAVLGFILTQMEEPGHMLSIACLLALRWHEWQSKQSSGKFTI